MSQTDELMEFYKHLEPTLNFDDYITSDTKFLDKPPRSEYINDEVKHFSKSLITNITEKTSNLIKYFGRKPSPKHVSNDDIDENLLSKYSLPDNSVAIQKKHSDTTDLANRTNVTVDFNVCEASYKIEPVKVGVFDNSKLDGSTSFAEIDTNTYSISTSTTVSDKGYRDWSVQTEMQNKYTKDNQRKNVEIQTESKGISNHLNAFNGISLDSSCVLFESNHIVKLKIENTKTSSTLNLILDENIKESDFKKGHTPDDYLITNVDFNKIIKLGNRKFNVINQNKGQKYKLMIYDITPREKKRTIASTYMKPKIQPRQLHYDNDYHFFADANSSDDDESDYQVKYRNPVSMMGKQSIRRSNNQKMSKPIKYSFYDQSSDDENDRIDKTNVNKMYESKNIFRMISRTQNQFLTPPVPTIYSSISDFKQNSMRLAAPKKGPHFFN